MKRISVVVIALTALALPRLAAAQCPAGSTPFAGTLDAGTIEWEVEGPVAAVDTTARTITTNGMTFSVPAGVLVDTGLPTGLSLECWADPATPGCFASVPATPKSIIGGTVIALGTFSVANGCLSYDANSVSFLFNENVAVGALTTVDAPGAAFTVNGATVQMNPDPRVPAQILDLAGNPITIDDLAGREGETVSVEGYYENGVLCAVTVETDVPPDTPGLDGVAVERARYRADKRNLEVRGQLFVAAGNTAPTTAALYAPGTLDAEGDGCTGTFRANMALTADAATGALAFEFRSPDNQFAANPGTVCVASPNGGADEAPTTTG